MENAQQPSAKSAGVVRARRRPQTARGHRKETMSVTRVGSRQRLDLHNASIDLAAATAGQCGFTHLPSGRICRLPHRHLGSCKLQSQADQPTPEAVARRQTTLPPTVQGNQSSVYSPTSRPTHQESQ